MADRPTLILDVMGADLGIAEMVRGAGMAISAQHDGGFNLVLVTAEPEQTERLVAAELAAAAAAAQCTIEVLPAPQRLPEKIESPVEVFRDYPQCSIRVAMDRAKGQPHCAVISPGTTGLVMTSALFTLGRVKGIERPPIGTPMPTRGKDMFFVDGGSNVDCRASHLYQFAVLAHLYIKCIRGIKRPTIALLSNGSEAYKGNTVVREAAELLSQDQDLNFVGFVEGHTVFSGDLDIMVCDGFLGNIFLKLAEGMADVIIGVIRSEFRQDLLAGLAAKFLQRRAFKRVANRMDYTRIGGAPLLGLNGNVVICHGRSPARAIGNALSVGRDLALSDIAAQVAQYFEAHAPIAKTGNGAR
jgi:phosphate acyltransferase